MFIAWNDLSAVLDNFRAGRPGVQILAGARSISFLQILQANISSYSEGTGVQAAFI
jgi:hypothetical protein